MVTSNQVHKLNRRPIRDPYIVLVEFRQDGSGVVHRAAANNEDVISNGETYVRSDIRVTLPKSGESETTAQITLSNINRVISSRIMNVRSRIGCRIMVVDASEPDVIVKIDTKNLMYVPQASVDDSEVTGTLMPRIAMNEPFPPRRTTRDQFPGTYFTA